MTTLPPSHTAAMMLLAWLQPGRHELEPYEAGWAREAVAILYVREIRPGARLRMTLEVSADGLRWIPASATSEFGAAGGHRMVLTGFGNWLRATFEVDAVESDPLCADFYWVLQ